MFSRKNGPMARPAWGRAWRGDLSRMRGRIKWPELEVHSRWRL